MHGSTVQALALAHRIFEHLRFRLNVDQRAPEVVAAELRERCHALQTRPDGLDSYRAAWELVWRGPDLGDCAASEDLVERLADVYAETGLRVADRLLDGARRDELVALSDHLTGLAERLVVDGAQAVADALESPDPWERAVAAAIGRDQTLPGPSERASPEGRIRALLDGLAPYPRDAACRDLWAAVAGGQALPDDALDRITEAVATAHVLNARLLVRSALVHALRTGTARTWPESWADHLASALVHVDAHGADPLPTLLTLQPWTGSAKESALCAWVRPDPTARFARLLPWLDVESGPAILATLQRFAGLVLDAGSTGLLARALLEGSADARRRAAEVLRAAADAEGIAARWRSDLVIRALHSTLEDPDPAVTQIAAEALATLGALDPAASLNAAARAGLAEHWDAHFDAAAARGLAQLVMDPSSNVSWRAAHALEVPGRDALWPGDDVAEALGRHGTERAIWWHFRLACAHPARLQHPLPADMPAWATCARCRHLPASSGGPLPPTRTAFAAWSRPSRGRPKRTRACRCARTAAGSTGGR